MKFLFEFNPLDYIGQNDAYLDFHIHMKRRQPIFIIHKESLLSMPTRQLLGRLRALHCCEESLLLSDRSSDEVLPSDQIIFKETVAWKNAYTELKQVLAGREHINRRQA